MKQRKNSKGSALSWEASEAHPSVENSSYSYIEAENASGLWISESEAIKPLLNFKKLWQPTSQTEAKKNVKR